MLFNDLQRRRSVALLQFSFCRYFIAAVLFMPAREDTANVPLEVTEVRKLPSRQNMDLDESKTVSFKEMCQHIKKMVSLRPTT